MLLVTLVKGVDYWGALGMIKIFGGRGQVTWMQTGIERHPKDQERPRGLAEVGCLDRLKASWQSSSAAPAEVLEFLGYAHLSYWITREGAGFLVTLHLQGPAR